MSYVKFLPLIFLLTITVLQACSKVKIEEEILRGIWSCNVVKYSRLDGGLAIVNSELLDNAFINFTNEYPPEKRGATIYGEYASGRARLPLVYGNLLPESPVFVEGRMLFVKRPQDKSTWNYKNKYKGSVLFQPFNSSYNDYLTFTTRLTLFDEDKMIIRLELEYSPWYLEPVTDINFELILNRA